jgi:hypothetical protein
MEKFCVYCHGLATTEDHVPAVGMFPKGEPVFAVVPACEICNNKRKSLDDDYFRNILCYTIDDEYCHQYHELIERAKRAILRKGSEESQKILEKMIKYQDFFGPDGAYLYSKPYLEPNQNRINEYVKKIVIGLIWHEYRISSTKISGAVKKLEFLDRDKPSINAFLNGTLSNTEERVTSADVLRYQISQPAEKGGEYLVAFCLWFYRSHCWIGVIGLGLDEMHRESG